MDGSDVHNAMDPLAHARWVQTANLWWGFPYPCRLTETSLVSGEVVSADG